MKLAIYLLLACSLSFADYVTKAPPAAGGSGTVTSVGLSAPSFLSVTGSPVTTSGTLTLSLTTQLANKVFAGPTSGGAAAPTFRSLVNEDVPAGGTNTQIQFNSSGLLAGFGSWTGSLMTVPGNIAVPSGNKIYLDSPTNTTYLIYNSGSNAVELYVGGVKVTEWGG